MKKSIASPLLSGFVFPGLGQINNGHIWKGVILIITATLWVIILFWHIVSSLLRILKETPDVELTPDWVRTLTQQVKVEGGDFFIVMFFIFIMIWVVGIVDAFFCARKREKKKA